MKLWSKEALILGGLFGVLETPLSLLGFESLTDILFLLFIVCLIMLCLNRVPKFLTELNTKRPKTSYYLTAVGWIPYFMIMASIFFWGSTYFISYSKEFIVSFLYSLAYTGLGLAIISLVIAFIRINIKKKEAV